MAINDDTTLLREDRRAMLAHDAAYEIEGLAKLLLESQLDPEDGVVTRTLLRRVRSLANIQMSAIGDPGDSLESLRQRMQR